MKLKETAFCYNVKTGTSSTPDWGAEVGQGEKKLMNVEGVSNILNGMLYYKIDDIDDIKAAIGKGSSNKELSYYSSNTSIVLASVINSVKVNGELLDGQSMIMFLTKDERIYNSQGEKNKHYHRRYLKFSDKATYKDEELNKKCIEAITEILGCTPNGSWFISEMFFVEESLCLTAYVIDRDNPRTFRDKEERTREFNRLKLERKLKNLQPNDYSGDFCPKILYGPPGTGKTYKMQTDYIAKFQKMNRFDVTFHQSFSYEEFVEGIKPIMNSKEESDNIKYDIELGVFKKACERAVQLAGYVDINSCIQDSFENRDLKFKKAIDNKKTVLLCIDEINRGNVAAIFGDLISLIESDKRLGSKNEMTVKLPYSKEEFGVPANLLIVGTMNTADRSIQLLDTALRRRFKFEELLPQYEIIINDNAKTILKNINNRIRCLLNKDNQIGHANFIHAKNNCEIFSIMINKVIPLLEEYFYNDTEKIRFVLNEDGNVERSFYIEDKEAKEAYNIYNKEGIDEDKSFYMLNEQLKKLSDEDKCGEYLANLLNK